MIDNETKMKIIKKLAGLSSEMVKSLVYYEDEDDNIAFDDIAAIVKASSYAWGRSKLVLSFRDIEDYVVKIPIKYCGQYDSCDVVKYSQAVVEGVENDDPSDYCRIEALMYEKVASSPVKDMFAETSLLCTIDGEVPIYVSEKVTETFAEACTSCFGCKPEGLDVAVNVFDFDLDIPNAIGTMYGKDKLYELVSFMQDNHISDIHNDNIGYDKNGNIKIIDYPGFFD